MKKIEKLDLSNVAFDKSELANVTGGTSSTTYSQTGCVAEMEQEVDPVTKEPIGLPKLVYFPSDKFFLGKK